MSEQEDFNPFSRGKEWLQRHGWIVNPMLTIVLLLLVANAHRGPNASFDATAISLTVLEVFLVVLAFFGFWVIRREAIAAAEDAAVKAINERGNATLNSERGGRREGHLDPIQNEPTTTPPTNDADEATEL